jgi:queuine/archaeosine tRNA-ribosyltransferase
MFDCVMPTQCQKRMLFTANGTINIKKKWAWFSIDEMAITYVDTEYTKRIYVTCLRLMNI